MGSVRLIVPKTCIDEPLDLKKFNSRPCKQRGLMDEFLKKAIQVMMKKGAGFEKASISNGRRCSKYQGL